MPFANDCPEWDISNCGKHSQLIFSRFSKPNSCALKIIVRCFSSGQFQILQYGRLNIQCKIIVAIQTEWTDIQHHLPAVKISRKIESGSTHIFLYKIVTGKEVKHHFGRKT